MRTQAEKALAFRALHQRDGPFIIPNPWDPGTARLLAGLGFEALATTSAGYAFSRGQRDNAVGRERMMEHLAEMAAATELPLSGDLENGFGDSPEAVAETLRLAARAGLVGGSIEDATGRDGQPIYEEAFAAERVRAAAEAVRALPFPFTLTARAENYLNGRPDLKDTIRRLQAYQEAGADVLFAPGLTRKEDIAAVVSAVDRPVNVLMGLQGVKLSQAVLAELGVKRISVGSALSRAALGAFLRAAGELRNSGTFSFAATQAEASDNQCIFGGCASEARRDAGFRTGGMEPVMKKQTFKAEVLSGHKGCAVQVPFDPEELWHSRAVAIFPGRRHHRVRGTVNGATFESALVARAKKHFLLLDAATLYAARASVGDTVDVALEPMGARVP